MTAPVTIVVKDQDGSLIGELGFERHHGAEKHALRAENRQLRAELDAALATIATLSDRVRDKDRTIARLERNNDVLHRSYRTAKAEAAQLARDPRPEMHATIERLDVETVTQVDDGITLVPNRISLVLTEPGGKRRVRFERVEHSALVDPNVDDLGLGSVADGTREHEAVPAEHVEDDSDVQERLMPQEHVDLTHRDPSAIRTHEDSSAHGQPDTARDATVEAGTRGGPDSGPRADADGGAA